MNPITNGQSLTDEVCFEDAESVPCSAETHCEASIISGQSSLKFEAKDQQNKATLTDKNAKLPSTHLCGDKNCSGMIYKDEKSSVVSICGNSHNNQKENGLYQGAKVQEGASTLPKQSSKLTDIVKVITEKKRQTSSEYFDSNSTFRCRFAIKGVTAVGPHNEDLRTDVMLSKDALTKEKGKVNRRKQRPQKAILSNDTLPIEACNAGVH